MIDWTVEVRDITRARVGQLSEHDLTDFLCVPVANGVGSWSLSLPDTVIDASGRRVPHRLCEALRQEGAGLILTGPGGYTVSGQTTFAEKQQGASDPHGSWRIEGVTDAVELAQALAYPQPSNVNPATQTVANDIRTGVAETLMRAYVNANIGPGAPVARRVPGLSLAVDEARGPVKQKSPRFTNLLTLLQDVASGTSLLFDIVQVDAGLVFQVSSRRDVSAAVQWDVENSQLEDAVYGWTMPGLTRAIVAGGGEGVDRTIVEVTTAESLAREAVWGRVERFIDQRQTSDTAELTQAGLEALAEEGITSTGLRVKPSARISRGFGTEWKLGDLVTVVIGDTPIVAQVSETPISITAGGVLVGAVLGDPTGTSPEAILAARQDRADQRISNLERNTAAGDDDTGWVTSGLSIVAATDWSLASYRLRRVGNRVAGCVVITRTGAALTADAGGNMSDLTMCTMPVGWWNGEGYTKQCLASRAGFSMWLAYATTTGDLVIAGGLPSVTLPSGTSVIVILDYLTD